MRRYSNTINYVLFMPGAIGLIYQVFFSANNQPTLLMVFSAMVGVPAFLSAEASESRTIERHPGQPAEVEWFETPEYISNRQMYVETGYEHYLRAMLATMQPEPEQAARRRGLLRRKKQPVTIGDTAALSDRLTVGSTFPANALPGDIHTDNCYRCEADHHDHEFHAYRYG